MSKPTETETYGRYQFPNGLTVGQLKAQLETLPDDAVVKALDSDGLELKLVGPPIEEVNRMNQYSGRGGMLDRGLPEFFVIVGGTA